MDPLFVASRLWKQLFRRLQTVDNYSETDHYYLGSYFFYKYNQIYKDLRRIQRIVGGILPKDL